jgi:hypothetical protein
MKGKTKQIAEANSKTNLHWNKKYISLLQNETKDKVPVHYVYEYNAEQELESREEVIFEKPTFIESFTSFRPLFELDILALLS